MQRALIAFQRQHVVAALIDDLPGNLALTVERISGHDGAFEGQHLQQLRHRGDLVRLGLGGDLRQDQPLLTAPGADHVQGGFAAGAIERAPQHFAVDGDDALASLGKHRREPLEGGTELHWIKQPEQPAEGIVAGQAVPQCEETTQEWLFRAGEQRHVHRPLPAAQNRAQGDQKQLVEVVQGGIAGPWIVQALKARDKLLHGVLPGVFQTPPG